MQFLFLLFKFFLLHFKSPEIRNTFDSAADSTYVLLTCCFLHQTQQLSYVTFSCVEKKLQFSVMLIEIYSSWKELSVRNRPR